MPPEAPDSRAQPEGALGPCSPGMPYGLAPIPGGWPVAVLSQLFLVCLLATTSSKRLLRGFYSLFFTKFLLF